MPSRFPLPLNLRDGGAAGGTRIFILTSAFVFLSPTYGEILCPEGFETDGISTPRVLWPFIGPTSNAFPGAVLHDFSYRRSCPYRFTRKQADHLFLEAMEALEVGFFERHTIHKALRGFGWTAYHKRF
jgi:hypothetical protein